MSPNLQLFSSLRVNAILQEIIQDPRLLPGDLLWESRIPDVPALEEEIMARFYGFVFMADLIADDAKAGTYNMGAWTFESNKVPNIKVGVSMDQATINLLQRIEQYGGNTFDLSRFDDWQAEALMRAMLGVRQRKEQLRVAMLMDSLVYDRLGIKIPSGSWNIFPDLKITTSLPWDNTNATPVTDVNTARRVGRVRYGKRFNRMTTTTAAIQYAAATTEFQNQVKAFGYGFGGIPIPAIPLQSDSMIVTLFSKIIAGEDPNGGPFTIEIDDSRAWQQDLSGKATNAPYQITASVILTDSRDDGNRFAWDFAQGIITESIVAQFAQMNIVGGMGMGSGPMGYVTSATADANPPGLNHWAVDRGFPRRKDRAASCVLIVGNFSDTISTAIPSL